jgi:hypothetical protein
MGRLIAHPDFELIELTALDFHFEGVPGSRVPIKKPNNYFQRL